VYEPAGSSSRDVLLQLLRPNLGTDAPPDQGGNDSSSSNGESNMTGADGDSPPAAADTAAALAADAVTAARGNADADTLMRGTTDASSVQLQPQPGFGANTSNSGVGSAQLDASQQQAQQQQDIASSASSNSSSSSSNTNSPGGTSGPTAAGLRGPRNAAAAAARSRSPLEVLLAAVANRWLETRQFASSGGGVAGGGSVGDVRAAWQELMGELQKQQPELVSCD
jgi:hypothetical protein